jgi:hypothetical protein
VFENIGPNKQPGQIPIGLSTTGTLEIQLKYPRIGGKTSPIWTPKKSRISAASQITLWSAHKKDGPLEDTQ